MDMLICGYCALNALYSVGNRGGAAHGRHADAEEVLVSPQIVHLPGNLIGPPQQGVGAFQQKPSLRRQHQPPPLVAEEVHAELALQLPDGVGNGGLGDMQLLRSPGDAVVLAHRLKLLQFG
jgi:hypothetical protein